MKYSSEKKLFTYISALHSSWKKCCRKFHENYSDSTVPYKAMIYSSATKLWDWCQTKRNLKKYVLTEEKQDDVSTWLEARPKMLRLLALQCELEKGIVHVGTKLLKL